MSIEGMIRDLVKQGDLRLVPTSSDRIPAKRQAYLTRVAQKECDDPYSAVNLLCGRPYIKAALERWVEGRLVFSSGKKPGFLKPLKAPPPDVWEIRVMEPQVQGRIFCRFTAPDCLVITSMRTRKFLDAQNAFENEMSDCVSQWSAIFSPHQPHCGSTITDFVSENVDDFNI